MKKSLLIAFTVIFFCLALQFLVSAHPGRTASDGCHYCRSHCASFGEIQDARHCH